MQTQDVHFPDRESTELPDDGLGELADQAKVLEGAGQTEAATRAAAAAAGTIAAMAAEVYEALEFARTLAAPTMTWWDKFETVWSDEALHKIADAGAAVMQRHGWTMAEAWVKLGPYIALVGALAMPSFVTWQAIAQHRAEQAAAKRKPAPTMPPMEMGA